MVHNSRRKSGYCVSELRAITVNFSLSQRIFKRLQTPLVTLVAAVHEQVHAIQAELGHHRPFRRRIPFSIFSHMGRHVPTQKPKTDKGRTPQRRCVVCCYSKRIRRETTFYCNACPNQPYLCLDTCYQAYHAHLDKFDE